MENPVVVDDFADGFLSSSCRTRHINGGANHHLLRALHSSSEAAPSWPAILRFAWTEGAGEGSVTPMAMRFRLARLTATGRLVTGLVAYEFARSREETGLGLVGAVADDLDAVERE